MNQTYVYRKHLRAPFHYMMLMEMIIFFGVIILMVGVMVTEKLEMNAFKVIASVIFTMAFFMFITLEMVIIYFVFFKRFKSISVTLTDDAIVYTNSKGQTLIPYEDIEKLKFPSIKYTGGWVKIVYRGGNIRLTVVLEHIGDFISDLKEKMSERELSRVYNAKKLFSFYKTAVFADESWERLYHSYKFVLVTNYLCIILTTVILRFYGNPGSNKFFMYGSLIAPFLGYLISEIIIGIQVKKRVKRDELRLLPRNQAFEQKVFKISLLGFSIGYLLILLVVMI